MFDVVNHITLLILYECWKQILNRVLKYLSTLKKNENVLMLKYLEYSAYHTG